jgi:hypothetical protein
VASTDGFGVKIEKSDEEFQSWLKLGKIIDLDNGHSAHNINILH